MNLIDSLGVFRKNLKPAAKETIYDPSLSERLPFQSYTPLPYTSLGFQPVQGAKSFCVVPVENTSAADENSSGVTTLRGYQISKQAAIAPAIAGVLNVAFHENPDSRSQVLKDLDPFEAMARVVEGQNMDLSVNIDGENIRLFVEGGFSEDGVWKISLWTNQPEIPVTAIAARLEAQEKLLSNWKETGPGHYEIRAGSAALALGIAEVLNSLALYGLPKKDGELLDREFSFKVGRDGQTVSISSTPHTNAEKFIAQYVGGRIARGQEK